MSIAHIAVPTTGSIINRALLGEPYSTLGELTLTDRNALWGGCLDATDRLLTGSHTNLVRPGITSLVFADFRFRWL